jgi:hypothetical protein
MSVYVIARNGTVFVWLVVIASNEGAGRFSDQEAYYFAALNFAVFFDFWRGDRLGGENFRGACRCGVWL